MIEYLSNPLLKNIRQDFKGNPFINNRFEFSENPSKPHNPLTILKWQISDNPQKEEKKKDKFRLKVIENKTFMNDNKDMIVWLGHSSFFMRINGVTLLTDPVLIDLPFVPRLAGLPCAISDIKNIDFLLISHGHRDHYDEACVNKIISQNPDIQILMPLRISVLLGRNQQKVNYQEAGWWQYFDLDKITTPNPSLKGLEQNSPTFQGGAGGGFMPKNFSNLLEISFLPAKHWNRRGILDYNQTLWGSFFIKNKQNNQTFYFAGDTAYDKHFTEIKTVMGAPDVCFMPVGAYKPANIMCDAHTTPQEALQAYNDLGGNTFIPMHYGTYDLADEPLGEPARLLKTFEDNKQIKGDLKFLEIGEEFLL